MTSSSEARVFTPSAALTPMHTPELREGVWTRTGTAGVRGDATTESLLDGLAERTRTAARSQGYSVGWAQGHREGRAEAAQEAAAAESARREAEERRRCEHDDAVTALRTAARLLGEEVARLHADLGQQAGALALAVTEELVGRALGEDTPADVVRRALGVVPDGEAATVRLHPTVAADVGPLPECVAVDADPAVGPHDAVVELADHLVELDTAAALRRLGEVLR